MFKVHEEFPDHEKSEALHRACRDESEWLAALGLWLVMGCDSRARLADGRFSEARLQKIAGKGSRLAQKLVDAKLWHRTAEGYEFHDWADVQETKEEVQNRRAKDRRRKRTGNHADSTTPSARNPSGSDSDSEMDSRRARLGREGKDQLTPRYTDQDSAPRPHDALCALWAADVGMLEIDVSSRDREAARQLVATCDRADAPWEAVYARWRADEFVQANEPALTHLANNLQKYLRDRQPLAQRERSRSDGLKVFNEAES